MRGLRLAGKVKIGIYDAAGVLGPIFDGGNTTELTLAAEGEDVEILSTDYDNHGAALDSMSDPKPTTGSWKINRFTWRTLALNCAGTVTKLAVAAAPKTKNDFVAVYGEGQRIADVPIDTLVVKDATDAITYVAGTDYEVNLQLAVVTPLAGASFASGATLHLVYNETAQADYEILGATALGQKIWFGLDGRNLFDNSKVLLVIDKMKLKPSGTISFIGTGDAAEAQFDFTAIVPDGQTQAYKLRVQG
jgi:hypothetical protein